MSSILTVPSPELAARLREIRHVALDMDGTIYTGGRLFPGTLPALERLTRAGIGYSFLTNNSSRSREDYLRHLAEMGVPATGEQMYTSSLATIDYLRKHHPEVRKVFLLGTPSLVAEFERAGFVSAADDPADRPDAVVAGFDTTLCYDRLCRAAWWVKEGLPYLATNPDRVCPTDLETVLVDCGSVCVAIAHATGRMPDVVIGKPNPGMLEGILTRHDLRPEEVAMVGDRIYTDVQMARNAGALGVLVLSGETTPEIVRASETTPDVIAEDLAHFADLLLEDR